MVLFLGMPGAMVLLILQVAQQRSWRQYECTEKCTKMAGDQEDLLVTNGDVTCNVCCVHSLAPKILYTITTQDFFFIKDTKSKVKYGIMFNDMHSYVISWNYVSQ